MPEQVKEHVWLHTLVGEWRVTGEMGTGPGEPPMAFESTESARALGDGWVVSEGEGEMPDGSRSTMLTTLGYDPVRKRLAGTAVGSMMPFLWVYDTGSLDDAGTTATLECDGPKMDANGIPDPSGAMARYRDVYTALGDDERTLTSFIQGDDGQWKEAMKMTYRRK